MEDFEDNLAEAGAALSALADGPGRAAADALGAAFDEAGGRIERALSQAARSGELDFSRMAEGILRDLARVAAEALVARAGLGAAANQTVNMNFSLGAGADANSVMASRNTIAATLARAASAGRRFL